MNMHPTAKALQKKVYSIGAPVMLVIPLYCIPVVFLFITKWLIGSLIMIIPPVIMHVLLRKKFRKDEYWMKYALEELKSKAVQRPYT